MKSDKQLKQEYKRVFSQEYRKYYPVQVLEKWGYRRGKCRICGKSFWALDPKRAVCGDASCIGRYDFLERRISQVKLSYVEVWREFARLFKSLGYKPIKRYPVVARWRDDTLFVKASIYDFQPHVTSGVSPPPAKRLVVPQTCLRFNDVDNVGVTMSHMTGFVMIGQHAFLKGSEWSQERLFKDICTWLFDVLRIPKEEVVFHEDAWAGGGNLGPCMEYFSGGLELGNQVYMIYEVTPKGLRDLKLKVLDMGMGQERVAWFTQQSPTIYDAAFPNVMKRLIKATGHKINSKLLNLYVPFGAMLNLDEVKEINGNLSKIALKLSLTPKQLEGFLAPTAALYSIAEHARSLLIALNDGTLPSNVGDAYNLRMLFRRAQNLIEKHRFKVKLPEVCKWHAEELKGLFPELKENIMDVEKILDVELKKYKQGKRKAHAFVMRLLKSKQKLTAGKMVELYDSHGINPTDIEGIAGRLGIKVRIPRNFYALVSERHLKKGAARQERKKIKLPKIARPTELLYYKSSALIFDAKVLAVFKLDKETVAVLNRTAFYPEGGGQEHDIGTLDTARVIYVEKLQGYVLHHIEGSLTIGQVVRGKVDKPRRMLLSVHHTATHILNAAAREVLGNHVYQAGAKKTTEKARLDITHYEALSKEELRAIEKKANEVIARRIPIHKRFMNRAEAERRYGIRIYQGGYIPGKMVRIVEIEGLDVEACGGTHLDNTGEVGKLIILKSSKIQDGVVRLEFVAGPSAYEYEKRFKELSSHFGSLEEAKRVAAVFNVPLRTLKQTVDRFSKEAQEMLSHTEADYKIPVARDEKSAKSLFEVWKKLKKLQRKAQLLEPPKEGSIKIVDVPLQAMVSAIARVHKGLLINKQGHFVFKGSEAEFKRLLAAGARGGGREVKQGIYTGEINRIRDIFS